MDPRDWREPPGRLRGNPEATVVHCSMDEPSRQEYWDSHCTYSTHTHDQAQNMHLQSTELHPHRNDFHAEESGAGDPGGAPIDMDVEDPELDRKRRELREIEERIMRKKAAIAMKKTEPYLSSDEQSPAREDGLKARVNAILLERQSVNFLSVIPSLQSSGTSSSLSKDALPQKDHPLKLRVQPLMIHRSKDRHFEPMSSMVPDVTPPSPVQSVSPLPKEQNNEGFQRFLSVLNKGVDMDFLSKIVNDDGEDLPVGEELLNAQSSVREDKPDFLLWSEGPHSNSGALGLGHRQSKSGERNTDPPSQETSLSSDRLDDNKNKDDRGAHCLVSSNQSKSPLQPKDEEKPKVDEPHVHLQNILKTLGLNLGMDDMSKLTDRTQERLYGKKQEDVKTVCEGEEEEEKEDNQQSDSHGQDRVSPSHSTSSSSSSPSSRLTPRSRRRSLSRDQRRRRASEGSRRQDRSKDKDKRKDRSRSRSRDRDRRKDRSRDRRRSGDRRRSRDRCRSRDGDRRLSESGSEASRETQRDGHRDEDRNETSAYMYPYPQNHHFPPYANHYPPAASPAFPQYCVSQYTQYNGFYRGTPDSYWAHAQGAIGPHPYPQNRVQQYQPPLLNSCPKKTKKNLCRPLTKPQYQIFRLVDRCLMTIPTRNERSEDAVKPEVEQPDVEKVPLTEAEIKQNLRKKLDAFNQKAKEKPTEPAAPLLSITGRLKSVEDQECLELEPAVSTEEPQGPPV